MWPRARSPHAALPPPSSPGPRRQGLTAIGVGGPETPLCPSWNGTFSRPMGSSCENGPNQGLERNRARPRAHEEDAAKTGRESHLLTSDPDQTPSLPFPSHIGLLTVLSGHVHDLFPPIPLQELGRERGQLAKEHHWASPGASGHQEDTVWDTQTGSYGNSGPVVSFPPCELIMPRLHEVCTSSWSPHCPPEQSHCSPATPPPTPTSASPSRIGNPGGRGPGLLTPQAQGPAYD